MEGLEAAMAKARAARQTLYAGNVPVPRMAPVDPRPLGDWSSLHTLEITPKLARAKRLTAAVGPEFASYYAILRARVLRQMKENGWTRLAVTSPREKSGKSTISVNLALSLARNDDQRVILMDFDMRRPSIAPLLDLRNAPNITGLLRPGAFFKDHAVRYGSNLAICPNRSKVPGSAELLQGHGIKEALDRIQAEWQPDIMIFDTPPMQGNDDNMGFFANVDCALIVASAGYDTLAQIDRCEQEVAGLTNVLGMVLNKCRYADKGNGTGYDNTYY